MLWRDFGGHREAGDADDAATAARECAEETLGLFHSCQVSAEAVSGAAVSMAARLRSGRDSARVVHALRQGCYHLFLARTPHVSALMFALATAQNRRTHAVQGAEKLAFAWVPLLALLQAVAAPAPHYRLACPGVLCDGAPGPEGWQGASSRRGLASFPLHPRFAHSLRQAWLEGAFCRLGAGCRGGVLPRRPSAGQLFARSQTPDGTPLQIAGPMPAASSHEVDASIARGLGCFVGRPEILLALKVGSEAKSCEGAQAPMEAPTAPVTSGGSAWLVCDGGAFLRQGLVAISNKALANTASRTKHRNTRRKSRKQRLRLRRQKAQTIM